MFIFTQYFLRVDVQYKCTACLQGQISDILFISIKAYEFTLARPGLNMTAWTVSTEIFTIIQ